MVNWFWSYRSWDWSEISKKKLLSQQKKYQNLLFSMVNILLMLVQNPLIHSIFWKS